VLIEISGPVPGNKGTAPDEVYIDSLHKEIVNRKNKSTSPSSDFALLLTNSLCTKKKKKQKHKIDQASVK
jgi:hypothetical protein